MSRRIPLREPPALNPSRLPPHDLDAEAAVLSAVMLDRGTFQDVADILTPEHFFSQSHELIWAAIVELEAVGKSTDTVTVAGLLRDKGELQKVGGTGYLATVQDATPAIGNVREHASMLCELWRRRQMMLAGHAIYVDGFDTAVVGNADYIAQAEQRILSLAETSTTRSLVPLKGPLVELFEGLRDGKIEGGDDTGYPDLNDQIGGWFAGDLYILAARPGMGKSGFAFDLAVERAQRGFGVAFFDLEMPSRQCVARIVASRCRVGLTKFRSNAGARTITQAEWAELTTAAGELGSLPFYLDDSPDQTVASITSKCRRLKSELARREVPLGLVVVDYLQLMSNPGSGSRELEVSAISRGLKRVAKSLDVPVLALAQLNRGVEDRKPPIPVMRDLRESGAIENDADTIMFLYREDYYRSKDPKNDDALDGVANLIIGKQRNGATGYLTLKFFAESVAFRSMERGSGYEYRG